MTLKRILVPVDFDEGSREALHRAASLAEQQGAAIDVVHVFWQPPPYVGFEAVTLQTPRAGTVGMTDYTRAAAEKEMELLLQSLGAELRERVQPRFTEGDPARAIVELAAEEHFDLIVMGTHGRKGLGHMLLGSVAERVIRRAPCPVMTVKLDSGRAQTAQHL